MRIRNLKRLPGRAAVLTAVFAALNLALLGMISVVLIIGTHVESLGKTPAKHLDLQLNVPEFPPLSTDYKIVRTRALFYSSREFYVAPDPAMQEPIPRKPNYKLTGTLTIPEKPMIALLTSMDGAGTRKVKEGDLVDGWTVKSIAAGKVVITIGSQTEEFVGTKQSMVVSAMSKSIPTTQNTNATAGVRVLGTGGGALVSRPVINGPRLYRPPPQ